ncbi:glycoside hydrolase family 28 protein [Natrarchaeobius sp. A-rgal3]|uniref:glycoside hydrolase family 28 protein n=1 Tax=Natrarchaeobius versutus TaxID=1679078 RepID=UPI003510044B
MAERQTSRYDVHEFGATGDGETLDTEAIQEALEACAGSGGTVAVPPGEYLTGPLRVGDLTTLHLEAGATVRFVGDYTEFPTAESRWEGWDQVGFHPCLLVDAAETVEITGRGTIDGSGEYWWQFRDRPRSAYPDGLRERLEEFDERNEHKDDVSSFTLRPPLLQVYDSKNVSVSGVTLRNSPFWNTHVVYSEDVTITDVVIENPADAPNGDGIDVDSSSHVRISDTFINAGDDAICIKSGKDEQGRAVGEPARNITVANCTVEAGHGGVVIGSEMSGDVRDVTVTGCTFTDTDRGIRIKTQRGRGGVVEDLRFDTLVMRRVACPFVINGYYFTPIDSEPEPVDGTTPLVRNVHFSNITAREVESAGFLAGLPERRFGEITFEDVRIDATRSLEATDLDPAMADGYEQRHGFFCKSISEVSFSNVALRTPDSTAFRFEETDLVSIDGLEVERSDVEEAAPTEETAAPAIEIENATETRIRGCDSPSNGETFLSIGGDASRRLSLAGNYGDLGSAVDVDADCDVTLE